MSNIDELKKLCASKPKYTADKSIIGSGTSNRTLVSCVTSSNAKGAISQLRQSATLKDDLGSRMRDFSTINKADVCAEINKVINAVEIIFLIDKSGSVCGTENIFRDGYNDFINSEISKKMMTKVTTVLFSEMQDKLFWRKDIEYRPIIEQYDANGKTALYDAICDNIGGIRKENLVNSSLAVKNTIVVIMTDGADNKSRNSIVEARRLITNCREAGWNFIFLGAGIDSKEIAASLGIPRDMAEDFVMSSLGIKTNFTALNNLLDGLRKTGAIPKDWAADIRATTTLQLGSGQGNKPKKLSLGQGRR